LEIETFLGPETATSKASGLKKVEIEAKRVATKILKKIGHLEIVLGIGGLDSENFFFLYIFWRARVCRPLLCLCRPFFIFYFFF
jgi:hypothetical protein